MSTPIDLDDRFEIHVEKHIRSQTFEIFAVKHTEDGKEQVVTTLIGMNFWLQRKQVGEAWTASLEPDDKRSVTIGYEVAQQLVNQLWAMGIRPQRMEPGIKDALEATQAHLKDMQSIAHKLTDLLIEDHKKWGTTAE